MKQTAVERLVEQMIERKFFDKNTPLSFTTLEHLANEAKQMEKDQREQAFVEGYKARALASNLIFDEASKLYAQQLFKKIFKSE